MYSCRVVSSTPRRPTCEFSGCCSLTRGLEQSQGPGADVAEKKRLSERFRDGGTPAAQALDLLPVGVFVVVFVCFYWGERCSKLQLSLYCESDRSAVSAPLNIRYSAAAAADLGSISHHDLFFLESVNHRNIRTRGTPVLVESAVLPREVQKHRVPPPVGSALMMITKAPRLSFSCFVFFHFVSCPVCSNMGLAALPN